MEPKKISFGFSRSTKRAPIFQPQPKEASRKVELIDCLEGQSIRIRDAVKEAKKEPLSIPIRGSVRSLADRIRQAKPDAVKKEGDVASNEEIPDSELTLDELAARELIREAKNQRKDQGASVKVLELKAGKDALLVEGKEEATLEDYESVPIGDYGFAMLRGMGWKEGMGIGKNQKKAETSIPELRPKGMGLGADKMASVEKPKNNVDKDGKELIIKKDAYAKIIAGQHKGSYCQVLGLDDEAGRVIVKTSLKNLVLSLNEFLLIPVGEEEYSKFSKVINSAKYEKFKERELSEGRSQDRQRKHRREEERRKHRRKSKDSSGEESGRRKKDRQKSRRRSSSGSSREDASRRSRHGGKNKNRSR